MKKITAPFLFALTLNSSITYSQNKIDKSALNTLLKMAEQS